MTLRTHELGEEAVSQGAEMGDARLDGIEGRGTLQVVRGRNRKVMEVRGTWRPKAEDTDVSSLVRAAADREPVRFQGRLEDPEAPQRNDVAVRVTIVSHAEYAFDARTDADERAPVLRVFNFQPVDPAEVAPDAA